MKLLLFTQAVDTNNQALGFFVRWIEALSSHVDHITVICLYKGEYQLPNNVTVLSLGKEEGVSRVTYIKRFFSYMYSLRRQYDAVFVHMNEEYVLLGGVLWKLLRKPVYLWRNHYAGSWRTHMAAAFCAKVFCTSTRSYTARFRNAVLMPVGVDTDRFFSNESVQRATRSILFLGRLAPSKRPEMLIDALGTVLARGISFTATFVGSPKPDDSVYAESLRARAEEYGLHDRVQFVAGVPNDQTPKLYQSHDLFVNCSPNGMFDKTIFEAAACGCRVLASSEDFARIAGESIYFSTASELATLLMAELASSETDVERARAHMEDIANGQALSVLAHRLTVELGISV